MPTRSDRRIQAVTFDLDGTLYRRDTHIIRVGWKLLQHRRLLVAWEEAVAAARRSRSTDLKRDVVRHMAASLQRPEDDVQEEIDFVLEHVWSASLQPSNVPSGITAALELLDELRIPRSVASDHPPRHRLECLGLGMGWATMACGETLGAYKPFPDILLNAAEKMGVLPNQMVHVGDRADTDGGAASAAGANFIRVGPAGVASTHLAQMLEGLLKY